MKALQPWKVVVDEQANVKIAKSRVYLDNECRKKECNFGNLITDAMVDSVRDAFTFRSIRSIRKWILNNFN